MTHTSSAGDNQAIPDIRAEQPVPRAPLAEYRESFVPTSYPRPGTAVLGVGGDIDDHSLPRFAEVLDQRLNSVLEVIVVDLSAATFLSVSALEVLANASLRARTNGTSLRLVVGTTPEVRRALHVAGLFDALACYAGVTEALERRAGQGQAEAAYAGPPRPAPPAERRITPRKDAMW
jgi:anti-anti-sigma factor